MKAGGGVGAAAGGSVGAATGRAEPAAGELEVAAAAAPNPGGGVENTTAGVGMLDGGQPGMFGALTAGGSRAEMLFRTETIWFICCCCRVSRCCSALTISSTAAEAMGVWLEEPGLGVVA